MPYDRVLAIPERNRMKGLKSWPKVHEAVDGFAASIKGQSFVAL